MQMVSGALCSFGLRVRVEGLGFGQAKPEGKTPAIKPKKAAGAFWRFGFEAFGLASSYYRIHQPLT